MKSADIKKIRKKMEKTLDSARFEHTLGVIRQPVLPCVMMQTLQKPRLQVFYMIVPNV